MKLRIFQFLQNQRNLFKYCFCRLEFAQNSELCRIIHLEDLCFNAYEESLKIFNHCNQVFKKEYFVLKKKKFKNTRGNSINISLGSEHLINAPKIFQEMIEQEFRDIINTWPKPNYLNKFLKFFIF